MTAVVVHLTRHARERLNRDFSTYKNSPAQWDCEAHDWEMFTLNRLAWLYGAEYAAAVDAGADLATNSDIEAWNNLGRAS